MALKVFLVEDETVIRQGLRDNIPWQQYGFRFVGEASDGEMALPMIRREQPDVVITDIKMPFMDGLSLTHIIKKELPDTRVIIISGYDDFEYAQRAIEEGVEQYLLKPITRSALQKALTEVREKIDQQEEQKSYLRKYQADMMEYEQSFRRNFFEKVFEGQTPLPEIYEMASKHSLDINAPAYNIIFAAVTEKAENPETAMNAGECQTEIMRYCLRYGDKCIAFRWSINVYGLVLKGDAEEIGELSEKFISNINDICERYEDIVDFSLAAGEPVQRLSQLPECYKKLSSIFSLRFWQPEEHILKKDMLPAADTKERETNVLNNIDFDMISPELIKSFLKTGVREEGEEFCENFILAFGDSVKNRSFWDFLLLNIRFATLGFVKGLEENTDEFVADKDLDRFQGLEPGMENLKKYMLAFVEAAMELRDEKNQTQGKDLMKKAIKYVEENYENDSLSLNTVAEMLEVSPSYLSAAFSSEKGVTFTEYVTGRRMEKAKELLLSGTRSGDVGMLVGYKNPQYFSFVFKKTQGMSPREFKHSK